MKKFLGTFFCFALGGWIGGFCIFAYHINHMPIDHDSKTQAIVVLTGGRNRIGEAVKLLNQGLSDKLLISGVEKNISLQAISSAQDVSLPSKKIVMENKSTNTVENAIETCAWLEKNHISSIRLVTSNYHLPRSIQEFTTLNPKLTIIPHPVFSENVAKEWWTRARSFCLIASEYNKFLFVWLVRRLKI